MIRILKALLIVFNRKPKYTFVYEEDKTFGGWMVYAKEWPYVTSVGTTKAEALQSLLEDIETIKKVKSQDDNAQVPCVGEPAPESKSYNGYREVANV